MISFSFICSLLQLSRCFGKRCLGKKQKKNLISGSKVAQNATLDRRIFWKEETEAYILKRCCRGHEGRRKSIPFCYAFCFFVYQQRNNKLFKKTKRNRNLRENKIMNTREKKTPFCFQHV